jgi:hypothetical protein
VPVDRTTESSFIADVKISITATSLQQFVSNALINVELPERIRKLEMWRGIPEQHRPPQRP